MVNKTLSYLASSFQNHNKYDPRLSVNGKMDKYLKSILRPFKPSDPKEQAQTLVTPKLLNYIFSLPKNDSFAQHIADLCNGIFFFVCRLCRYSKTTGTRRTKIITMKNIVFRQENKVIRNSNFSMNHLRSPPLSSRKEQRSLRNCDPAQQPPSHLESSNYICTNHELCA